jgi:hypothetical protein
MANVAFIRRVLYKLKQNYGYPVDLYKTLENSENIETGRRNVRRAKYVLKKAVILTAAELKRQFQYDMAYVAANQRFSYGGFYDTEALYVIVDRRDLPKGFEITLEDFAVYDHKRYKFDKAQLLEHKLAFWIEMRQAKGSETGEIHDESITSTLIIEQDVAHET